MLFEEKYSKLCLEITKIIDFLKSSPTLALKIGKNIIILWETGLKIIVESNAKM